VSVANTGHCAAVMLNAKRRDGDPGFRVSGFGELLHCIGKEHSFISDA
jgi:hypothetical protein